MASDAWEWVEAVRRYRSVETGRFLGPSQAADLRDHFLERQRAGAADLAGRLEARTITVQAWEAAMRARVRTVFVTEYAFGRGGTGAMTAADRGAVAALVREQYDFLHGFAAEVAGGDLSRAQIAARSQLYFNAATSAHGHGHARAHGGLVLPAQPGDGSTSCRANCRCRWSIDETDDAWEARWIVSGAAESCEDCRSRGAGWAPLTVAKENA